MIDPVTKKRLKVKLERLERVEKICKALAEHWVDFRVEEGKQKYTCSFCGEPAFIDEGRWHCKHEEGCPRWDYSVEFGEIC